MFKDACNFCNLQLDNLDKTLCYSFVLQHPANRIVVRIEHPQIYLIRAYKIHSNSCVEPIELPNDNYEFRQSRIEFANSSVMRPCTYTVSTYSDLIDRFATDKNTPYNVLGVVLRQDNTHCKLRNPTYVNVQVLRGNTPRMDYQYVWLRKNNKLSEFLLYFPEYKPLMSAFRKSLHAFTSQLFNNYVSCYICKQNKIYYFTGFYQRHMKYLHHIYINSLMPLRRSVTKQTVIDYVNQLDISVQLIAIQYNLDTA